MREQTLAFAQAIGNPAPKVFKADLSLGTAVVLAAVVGVLAIAIALRRLARIEIAGEVV